MCVTFIHKINALVYIDYCMKNWLLDSPPNPISHKDCSVGLAIRKAKKSAWETAPSKLEAKKAAEDAAAEKESKCLAAEAAEKGGKSDEGGSAEYVL